MKQSKETILKYLEALYIVTSQTPADKAMYDNITRFINDFEQINPKETKEYKELEKQWFLENQLCKIYKARLNKINNIITGRYD